MRYELVVEKEDKARFETVVAAVADEYETPWNARQRLAKARRQVFKDITQGVTREFFMLTEEIQALKDEIKVLTPNFFITEKDTSCALPKAIQALPDEPDVLKAILAKLYAESQAAKQKANKYEESSERHAKLYYTLQDHCDTLEKQLREKADESYS